LQQTNEIWNQYLKDTSINTGTRESLKNIKRLPINKEKIKNDHLTNNGQTVYNNTEREGGINGRKEVRQSNRDVFEQSTNEINTEGQTTINARDGFEKRFREAIKKE
jgi:hypothetical protein